MAATLLLGYPSFARDPSARGVDAEAATGAQASDKLEARNPASTLERDSGEFLALLNKVRNGADDSVAPLFAVAERMCAQYGRCDVPQVAEFYAGLSPTERRIGLEREDQFRALYGRVRDAGRDGTEGMEWLNLREDVLIELEYLAQTARAEADYTPAARALSLGAWLRLEARTPGPLQSSELARAKLEASQSLELFEQAGLRNPQLEPLWVLGHLQRIMGEPAAARESLTRCLREAGQLGRDEWRERATLAMVDLAREAGSTAEQSRLLNSLASWRNPGECWPLLRDHSALVLHRDDPHGARQTLERNAPAQGAPGEFDWHLLTGSAALREGDRVAAREHFDWLQERGDSPLSSLAEASWSLANDDPGAVIESLGNRALEAFPSQARVMGHALLGEAFLAHHQPDAAARELGAALGLARAQRRRFSGYEDENTIGEWIGLHAVALMAQAQAELGRPLEAATLLESAQSNRLRTGAAVDRAGLLQWSGAFDLGLLSWTVGPDFGLVVRVDASGRAEVQRFEHGRQAMLEAGRRLRDASQAGDIEQVERLQAEIAAVLFPTALRTRLEAEAGEMQNARLLLMLHGPLEPMPVELILSSILPEVVPVCLPGFPDNEPGATPAEFGPWSLCGPPQSSPRGDLPAARMEIDAILNLRPSAQRMDQTQSPRWHLQSGRALHFATHLTWGCGSAASRLAPLGLELPGGKSLCAEDVLDFGGPSPLVVLSACETAGGRLVDSEGIQGLAQAFLETGTRNLVASLWPVEDVHARTFSEQFHRALLAGARPSEAAHRARRALALDRAGPAGVGAFRLVGRD